MRANTRRRAVRLTWLTPNLSRKIWGLSAILPANCTCCHVIGILLPMWSAIVSLLASRANTIGHVRSLPTQVRDCLPHCCSYRDPNIAYSDSRPQRLFSRLCAESDPKIPRKASGDAFYTKDIATATIGRKTLGTAAAKDRSNIGYQSLGARQSIDTGKRMVSRGVVIDRPWPYSAIAHVLSLEQGLGTKQESSSRVISASRCSKNDDDTHLVAQVLFVWTEMRA